jgi:hypothetical protein
MEDQVFVKKDFALYLIEKTADDEEVSVDDILKNPAVYAYKSTSCGLALQYLGYFDYNEDVAEYLKHRGGFFLFHVTKGLDGKISETRSLSTREMFDLLPEDEIKGKQQECSDKSSEESPLEAISNK